MTGIDITPHESEIRWGIQPGDAALREIRDVLLAEADDRLVPPAAALDSHLRGLAAMPALEQKLSREQ